VVWPRTLYYISVYTAWYDGDVTVVTFRADEETIQAIRALQEDTGQSRSHIVRDAVLAARREARRAALRAEAEALREDPADRAEVRAILGEMGGGDAW